MIKRNKVVVNITISKELLEKLDRQSKNESRNRSNFIENVVKLYLNEKNE